MPKESLKQLPKDALQRVRQAGMKMRLNALEALVNTGAMTTTAIICYHQVFFLVKQIMMQINRICKQMAF